MRLGSLLQLVYPSQCLSCRDRVTTDFGLCGKCWRDTPFIIGLCCDQCGQPLPGDDTGEAVLCDDCLQIPRPWERGRAALMYAANARKLVLALKHGDRLDLARPAAGWMMQAARPILRPDMIVVPVPLHWTRLLKRRYNQAALLSRAVAKLADLPDCPDLLLRPRRTGTQGGRTRNGRFENMGSALRVHPRRAHLLQGKHVLVVDDVMTSGATFAAATEACLAAGATGASVLALARVAKEP